MKGKRVPYVNNGIVPESKAKISIHDRGFLQGYSVFDTTRTFNHGVFRLDEHLARFFKPLKYSRIGPGVNKSELKSINKRLLAAYSGLAGTDITGQYLARL